MIAKTPTAKAAAIIPPTKVMPEIAFAPALSGVCTVGGTFEKTSKPMKAARTNTTIP
jgi:hypothetical protein